MHITQSGRFTGTEQWMVEEEVEQAPPARRHAQPEQGNRLSFIVTIGSDRDSASSKVADDDGAHACSWEKSARLHWCGWQFTAPIPGFARLQSGGNGGKGQRFHQILQVAQRIGCK